MWICRVENHHVLLCVVQVSAYHIADGNVRTVPNRICHLHCDFPVHAAPCPKLPTNLFYTRDQPTTTDIDWICMYVGGKSLHT